MQFPSSIILETSALCNVKCLGCALHGPYASVSRPFGNMAQHIWEPVITEVGHWGKSVSISAHGGGEPLLNPDMKKILDLAKSFPKIDIGFLTNGMLVDESWAAYLVDTRINWIAFSIDGVYPQTHNEIRKNSDLTRVENNLRTLLNLKEKANSSLPKVMLNMVAYDAIKDQKAAFVKKWIDQVDSVMVSHYRNQPESKRWPGVPLERKPCSLLWSQAVIAWDGRLGLCCEDFNIDHSPGSLKTDPGLLALWNSKKMNRVRAIHSQGRYDDHPMCAVCDTWADSHVRQTWTDENGYHVVKTPSQMTYSR
jgi:pyruvate-formate lyase-activating enzyme